MIRGVLLPLSVILLLFGAWLVPCNAQTGGDYEYTISRIALSLKEDGSVLVEEYVTLQAPSGEFQIVLDVPGGILEESIGIRSDPAPTVAIGRFAVFTEGGVKKLKLSGTSARDANAVLKVTYISSDIKWQIFYSLSFSSDGKSALSARLRIENNSYLSFNDVDIVLPDETVFKQVRIDANSSGWLAVGELPVQIKSEYIGFLRSFKSEVSSRPAVEESIQYGFRIVNVGHDAILPGKVTVFKDGVNLGSFDFTSVVVPGDTFYVVAGKVEGMHLYSSIKSVDEVVGPSGERIVKVVSELITRVARGSNLDGTKVVHIIVPLETDEWKVIVDGAKWNKYKNDMIDIFFAPPAPGTEVKIGVRANLTYKR